MNPISNLFKNRMVGNATIKHVALLALFVPFLSLSNAQLKISGNIYVTQSERYPVMPKSKNYTTAFDYILKTPNRMYKIVSSNRLGLLTGDEVEVVASLIPMSSESLLYVTGINVKLSKRQETSNEIKSATFLLNYCGLSNPITHDVVKHNLKQLEKYYKSCSYGKTQFNTSKNIIVPGYVNIPCSGTYLYNRYDLSKDCGTNEIYALMYYAERYARERNINTKEHKRFILIMPKTPSCPWAGLGNVGCGSNCTAWINGGFDQSVVFHELGHTMGLLHSHTQDYEYGDSSCAMGCCSPVCVNAAQGSSLKWNKPIIELSNMPIGKWITYKIPGYALTDKNFIQYGQYFISFRVQLGQDVNLLPEYSNKVFIHSRPNPFDGPYLLAILNARQMTYLANSDLNIRVDKIVPNKHAIVSFFVGGGQQLPTSSIKNKKPLNNTSG